MSLSGFGISPTVITNIAANGAITEAEAKLASAEEAMAVASKQWESIVSGKAFKAANTGRNLTNSELTDMGIGLYKLVRGTGLVISAEMEALKAISQALKIINAKR